jgi:hypothetical protein
MIYLPKFRITIRDPYVSIEVARVSHQVLTPRRVSFNRFLTSLALSSFLSEVKRTFTNFLTAHHNLGSSSSMPSRLGGFISKSNKCHKDCFTKLKCSSDHKEYSLNLHLSFLTNHKILTKRGWRELTKAYDECILWVAAAPSKGGRRKTFILAP